MLTPPHACGGSWVLGYHRNAAYPGSSTVPRNGGCWALGPGHLPTEKSREAVQALGAGGDRLSGKVRLQSEAWGAQTSAQDLPCPAPVLPLPPPHPCPPLCSFLAPPTLGPSLKGSYQGPQAELQEESPQWGSDWLGSNMLTPPPPPASIRRLWQHLSMAGQENAAQGALMDIWHRDFLSASWVLSQVRCCPPLASRAP